MAGPSPERRSRRLSFRRGGERYDAALWYRRDGLTMEFGGIDRSVCNSLRATAA